jgi:hypothetical protein
MRLFGRLFESAGQHLGSLDAAFPGPPRSFLGVATLAWRMRFCKPIDRGGDAPRNRLAR